MTQESLARRAAGRGADGRRPRLRGRYGLLLILLIVTYLLSAFGTLGLADPLQIALFAAVLLLALSASPLDRRLVRLFDAATLIGSAGALAAALTQTSTGYGVAELWKGLILLLSAILIVRRVLARPTVTVQSIYGALSAYMIVGLMFAAFYSAMWHLGMMPFFANGQPASPQTFQYFSFATLTTLGYGDFTALVNGARAVAVIEALAGQVFLATLVARLVAAFRGPSQPARPAVTRRRPPRALRRAPATSHRGRPPGKPIRISSGSRPSQADRRDAADSQAPRPGP
jgi:Ion channel